MAEFEDLLAGLPAPDSEEPATLRQDILDELQDHLQCAVAREAVTHSDPQDVEQRVLARFGNPRRIARKLWFDAMKEKLLMQKLTLVLVSIVAVASATACGLMWSLARDFQAAAQEAQAANTKLLAQGQEANAELLKQNREMMQQLTTLANRPIPSSSPDWNSFKIRVVKNDENRTPAQGFRVEARGPHLTEGKYTDVRETTNEQGVADFGLVRPGAFEVTVRTPWGEGCVMQITVHAGKGYEKEIVAPVQPIDPIQVKPILKWPKEFQGKDLAAVVQIYRQDVTKVDGIDWSGGEASCLLIRPNGQLAVYDGVFQWDYNQVVMQNDTVFDPVLINSDPKIVVDSVEQKNLGFFPWHGREASFGQLSLIYLPQDADFPKKGEKLKRLAPASWLQRFVNQYPGVQIQRQDHADKFTSEELPNGKQLWTFGLTQSDVFVALTMMAPEQFPKLPAEQVIYAALDFLMADKDQNEVLSKVELSESSSRGSRLEFDEDPVPYQKFIEAYVKSYVDSENQRSRRRSG